MCLSCGCNIPDNNHGDARNITQQDIDERNITLADIDTAAEAAGTTREKVINNINTTVQRKQPHHAWGEAKNQSAQDEIDYGASRHERVDEQQNLPKDPDSQLTYHKDASGHQHLMRDGYAETEGSGYGRVENSVGHAHRNAQEGYDPTQSGVRRSKRRPGEEVDEPGRETGTAWGEELEMGKTDNPSRRNPAN
jgi:hypothetical protein